MPPFPYRAICLIDFMYCSADEIKIELCKVYFHVGEKSRRVLRKGDDAAATVMKNGDDLCKTGEIAKYNML